MKKEKPHQDKQGFTVNNNKNNSSNLNSKQQKKKQVVAFLDCIIEFLNISCEEDSTTSQLVKQIKLAKRKYIKEVA